MVRLRLKKKGKKHNPFFRIIAIDSRKSRDSAELKTLGFYEPKKGNFELDIDLYKEFISKGAKPTKNLLDLVKAQSRLSRL